MRMTNLRMIAASGLSTMAANIASRYRFKNTTATQTHIKAEYLTIVESTIGRAIVCRIRNRTRPDGNARCAVQLPGLKQLRDVYD